MMSVAFMRVYYMSVFCDINFLVGEVGLYKVA
jgi:hypothetical protein